MSTQKRMVMLGILAVVIIGGGVWAYYSKQEPIVEPSAAVNASNEAWAAFVKNNQCKEDTATSSLNVFQLSKEGAPTTVATGTPVWLCKGVWVIY